MKFRQPRQHDEKHLDFVRSLPCAICGDNTSTEAAHIRSVEPKYGKDITGSGRKPDDKWATPLCGKHHREQHQENEYRWWRSKGINCFTLAMTLYGVSGNHEAATTAIELHRPRHETEREFGERLIRYATESQHRHNDASRAVGTAPNRSNGDYGHTVERMRGGGGD